MTLNSETDINNPYKWNHLNIIILCNIHAHQWYTDRQNTWNSQQYGCLHVSYITRTHFWSHNSSNILSSTQSVGPDKIINIIPVFRSTKWKWHFSWHWCSTCKQVYATRFLCLIQWYAFTNDIYCTLQLKWKKKRWDRRKHRAWAGCSKVGTPPAHPLQTHTHTQTDRSDYNTLRR